MQRAGAGDANGRPTSTGRVIGVNAPNGETPLESVSVLPIRTYGDPVLAIETQEIDNIDGKIHALALTMIETMYRAPGVGLAANQVGISKRMFVYDSGDGLGPRTVINPRILEKSGEWTYEEGCLSVPGLSWEITRANRVHLVGLDLDGNPIDMDVDEYHARIFQHETDHLDGKLLLHCLTPEQEAASKKDIRKIKMNTSAGDGLKLFGR